MFFSITYITGKQNPDSKYSPGGNSLFFKVISTVIFKHSIAAGNVKYKQHLINFPRYITNKRSLHLKTIFGRVFNKYALKVYQKIACIYVIKFRFKTRYANVYSTTILSGRISLSQNIFLSSKHFFFRT